MPVFCLHEVKNGVGGFWVESAGCLVTQQHLGLGCKGTCNGYPLLLAARKLRRIGFGLFGKSHKLKKLGSLFLCLGLGHSRKLKGKADIFKAVFLHKQIKALKYHGYFSSCFPKLLLA